MVLTGDRLGFFSVSGVSMSVKILSGAGAACILLSALTSTTASAANYNVLVLGDFSGQSSDIEGALAAGGNITLSAYEVGAKLTSARNGSATLVAGKSINFSNGQLDHGSAVAPSIHGDFYAGNGTKPAGNALDFAALQSQYSGYANTAASLAANGTTSNLSGTMALAGTLSGLNIFTVAGSDLSSAGVFSLSIPTGASALINVTGTSASFQNMDFQVGGTSASNILFNFADGTTLTMNGIGFVGSILAPNADVDFTNGKMDGQLVARSLSGAGPTGQINDVQLNTAAVFGSSRAFQLAVPAAEPGTWMMLIAGFGAIGAMMRRRTRKLVAA
jgi:choice-of-anchor A domain-containing protein